MQRAFPKLNKLPRGTRGTEREAANRFLTFHRRKPGGPGAIQDVMKIDPRGFVLRQYDISLCVRRHRDRTDSHSPQRHSHD